MKVIELDQQARVSRRFSSEDIAAYRALTGDSGLAFGEDAGSDIVPGPLLGGMISYLLGTQLPGRGTNWLKQQLSFPTPAYVGEEISAVVTVTHLRPAKELVNLSTLCFNPDGGIVCQGEALVLVKDLEN